MSEVIEGEPRLLTAGNTVETLNGIDRDQAAGVLPSASDLDAVTAEAEIKVATAAPVVTDTPADEDYDPLDDENTFDVSRAEFNELRDALLRLEDRITKHNLGAPHKI